MKIVIALLSLLPAWVFGQSLFNFEAALSLQNQLYQTDYPFPKEISYRVFSPTPTLGLTTVRENKINFGLHVNRYQFWRLTRLGDSKVLVATSPYYHFHLSVRKTVYAGDRFEFLLNAGAGFSKQSGSNGANGGFGGAIIEDTLYSYSEEGYSYASYPTIGLELQSNFKVSDKFRINLKLMQVVGLTTLFDSECLLTNSITQRSTLVKSSSRGSYLSLGIGVSYGIGSKEDLRP